MKKTTQKEIKRLINLGVATQITDCTDLRARLETIAMSFGKYGMNGAMFKDIYTGQLYAIPARSSELFYYV